MTLRRWIGVVLIVVAGALAVVAARSVWLSDAVSAEAAAHADDALEQAWATGQAEAPLDTAGLHAGLDNAEAMTVGGTGAKVPLSAFARIEAPRLGTEWSYTVLRGVGNDALATGPGWYPETAEPGELGTTALAGHRMGYGAPFTQFSAFEVCDEITLTTHTHRHVYRVLPIDDKRGAIADCVDARTTRAVTGGELAHLPGRHITTPDDVGVLEPVPYLGWEHTPEHGVLTLTTCHPWYDNTERQIVHAVLAESVEL